MAVKQTSRAQGLLFRSPGSQMKSTLSSAPQESWLKQLQEREQLLYASYYNQAIIFSFTEAYGQILTLQGNAVHPVKLTFATVFR